MVRRFAVAVMIGLSLGAMVAEAVPLSAFPPNIQQFITALLSQAPADAQRQHLIAIQQLSPEGARRAVAVILDYANSGMINSYLEYAAVSEFVRSRFVPPNYQQAFVNGLWGVSPAEEQFAQQVFQVVAGSLQGRIGSSLPPPVTGPGWGLGGGIPPKDFQDAQHDLQCTWLPNLPSCRRGR